MECTNLMNGVTSNCLITGSLSFGGRQIYSSPDSTSISDDGEVGAELSEKQVNGIFFSLKMTWH